MASNPLNVLRVNSVEEQTRYRNAVAQILIDIQREHSRPGAPMTLHEIAETIDVSLGTISNAANKKNDLSVTYLARLGECFGPEMLNPYAALSGGRMVPLQPSNVDALPSLTASVHSIALARSPDSDGGERLTHRELLKMMPDLKAAQAAITNLILQAEGVRAA
jgi:hypothetical protein